MSAEPRLIDPDGMQNYWIQGDLFFGFGGSRELTVGLYVSVPHEATEKFDIGLFGSRRKGLGLGASAGVDVGRRSGDYRNMRGRTDDFNIDLLLGASRITEEYDYQTGGYGAVKQYEGEGTTLGYGPGVQLSWQETDTGIMSGRELLDSINALRDVAGLSPDKRSNDNGRERKTCNQDSGRHFSCN